MINLLGSGVDEQSKKFVEAKRSGWDNLGWIKNNIAEAPDQTVLVMVGGMSPTSFRLRVAQSHVRSDLLPSYWSHVMMLDNVSKNIGATKVHEISLEPHAGFGFPATANGVQTGKLNQYANGGAYPNIAVIHVQVNLKKAKEALDKFTKQRAVLDGVDLIVNWLAYVWGVARSPNPLLDGLGIPSAAMLEIVMGATGVDLTPGLESRSSCPEAIWQAARWWHEYYKSQNKPGLTGAYWTPHSIPGPPPKD